MHPIGPDGPVIPNRNALDFTRSRLQLAPDASLLVSCIRCGQLHTAARPFEFNPVCPACAGRLGRLAR
jgi:hypothetical protein